MRLATATYLATIIALGGCASSSVQPMAKNTFKVATFAAPACGPVGARNVAFKTASIEVIRRGGDKFIIVGDQADSDFWNNSYNQGMVVKVVSSGDVDYKNALSAREQLGPTWQDIVNKGAPITCA